MEAIVRNLKYTSATLQNKFNQIKQDYKNEVITKAQRNKKVLALNKKEQDFRKKEEEKLQERIRETEKRIMEGIKKEEEKRIKKEEEQKKKKEEQKKKKEEEKKRKEEEKKIKSGVILDYIFVPPKEDFEVFKQTIYNTAKKLINSSFQLQFTQNNNIVLERTTNINENKANKIYQTIMMMLEPEYNFPVYFYKYDENSDIILGKDDLPVPLSNNTRLRLTIFKYNLVIPQNIKQQYLDTTIGYEDEYMEGVKSCCLAPIYNFYKNQIENCDNEKSKKCKMTYFERTKYYQEQYPNGVPEDMMEEVAKKLNVKITIYDIKDNVLNVYNEKGYNKISYKNTRINHLESVNIINSNPEYKNEEEIRELFANCRDTQKFMMYQNTLNSFTAVKTKDKYYQLINDDKSIYDKFNEELNIIQYKFNAVKNQDLFNFVSDSVIINSTPTALCNNPNDIYEAKHYDMKRAYTQHKNNKYYSGFLGKITDKARFENFINQNEIKDFLQSHLGIFHILVNKNTNELLKRLGIFSCCKYTLTSPEIMYLMDKNVNIQLLGGVWGSTFDIEYPNYMYGKNKDKIPHYSIWAGKMNVCNLDDTWKVIGDETTAKMFSYQLGHNVEYAYGSHIKISIPKKSASCAKHITSFITSYTRINMYEMIEEVENKGGEVIKCVLDGLYFRCDNELDLTQQVESKQLIEHKYYNEWYYPSDFDISVFPEYNNVWDGQRLFLSGQGGAGKSYSVFNNPYLKKENILYVCPTNQLGQDIKNKYELSRYSTFHELMGIGCEPFYKRYGYYPDIIFLDELTMIYENGVKEMIENVYNKCKIIIAGDIDEDGMIYQTRNGEANNPAPVYIPNNILFKYIKYENDFRALDNQLKNIKLDIRDKAKQIYTNGGVLDAFTLSKYLKENYEVIDFNDAVNQHKKGDIWISGTHQTNKLLLNNNVISGYIDNKNNRYDEKPSEYFKCEERGSFTIHSYQGSTIENKKVFIVLDLFELGMLYTAISRVRHFNQLIFVSRPY